MKTSVLRVNVNQIKKEINAHYFKYKDIFYKILIINICVNNSFSQLLIQNTIIDDTQYNQYFLYLYDKNLSLKELLSELNITSSIYMYLDLSIYLDEFIRSKHSYNHLNVYSLTIDDDGFVSFFNKKIKKEDLNV